MIGFHQDLVGHKSRNSYTHTHSNNDTHMHDAVPLETHKTK